MLTNLSTSGEASTWPDCSGCATVRGILGGRPSGRRLTTFRDVGDDENKLDQMESVWLDRLVGAALRLRKEANRDIQPAHAISFEHGRLPGGKLDFEIDKLTSDETSELFALLGEIVGLQVVRDAPPLFSFA